MQSHLQQNNNVMNSYKLQILNLTVWLKILFDEHILKLSARANLMSGREFQMKMFSA